MKGCRSINQKSNVQSGETHKAVEFLADEINVVKNVTYYMVQKSGQWLYKAYESILFVYSYRRVPEEMGGLRNIIAIYAKTGVRWATYSRANKSHKRIHLKTLTARHEQSYPTVRRTNLVT